MRGAQPQRPVGHECSHVHRDTDALQMREVAVQIGPVPVEGRR